MAKRRTKQGEAAKIKSGGLAAFLPKREGTALIVILILYVLLSVLLFDPKPFVGGDNAAYVSLSKALAAGRGLAELWTPEQRPHTQYPFGFPLLLAPISLLRLPYAWYKIIPWLAGLAGILLSWHIFRKHGPWLAAATCLLLAANPHYLEYGHWVLSELPFLAALMLSLWALGRWEGGGDWRWFWGSVLAAAAGIHIRSAGVALLAAVPIHLAFRGKIKWALVYLAAVAVLMVPWAVRNAHWGTTGGYLDQFLMRDPYQPELGRAGLGELASRAGLNLKIYFTTVWPQLLFPGNEALGLGRAGVLMLLLLSLPALLGTAIGLRDAGAAGWLLLVYLLVSTMWPVVWTDLRFALPVLPMMLFFMLRGYRWILGLLFRDKAFVVSATLLAALATASLVPVIARTGPSMAMQAEYRRGDRLAGYQPQWRGFFQAAEWVKDNTPQGSIVVSRKPQLFHLVSGRRSFCYPFSADADSVSGRLAKADYIMVEPVSGTVQRYLIPAVEPHMGAKYGVVHAVGNPPTYVLKVNKENGDAQ
jgi:hypothetical protein